MSGVRKRGEEVRQFILDHVDRHGEDIAAFTAQKFGISRQAVNKHLHCLVEQEYLLADGATRDRRYFLRPLMDWSQAYPLDGGLQEDVVWRRDVRPWLVELPKSVLEIWAYGCTEMINNAIDHSSGKEMMVSVEKTAASTRMEIRDDGEGIFAKIQKDLGLEDERHAILELSKGKLTTDPSRHSGEGIFFTSRAFDDFEILSGKSHFSHASQQGVDWMQESPDFTRGTTIILTLSNRSPRVLKEVFKSFTSGEDFGFTKTVVPVRLAQYGGEALVSRSQAKRLLSRFDRFKAVVLDFEGVEAIGQAFADEVFRVFNREHPEIELLAIQTSENVGQMIRRATSNNP